MASKLAANPPLILVDANQTQASTEITYDGDGTSVVLSYQYDGQGSWFSYSPPKGSEVVGTWIAPPIQPGHFQEFRLLRTGAAANDGALARITVHALKARPDSEDWVTDYSFKTGGTYHGGIIVTTKTATNVLVEVGLVPPLEDQAGIKFFPGGPAGLAFSSGKTLHEFEIKDLLPGNKYFRTTRVSDQAGNWFYWWPGMDAKTALIGNPYSDSFRTLQREVRLAFDRLVIINSGDDSGEATGRFRITIFEGTNEEKIFRWGDDSYDTTTGSSLSLAFSHTISQRSINANNAIIAVNVHGYDIDEPFMSNEPAQNWQEEVPAYFVNTIPAKRLHFPVGVNLENVENVPLEFHATPYGPNAGTFNFAIKGTYSVYYR